MTSPHYGCESTPLAGADIPPELRLDFYFAPAEQWSYGSALRGPFCWSPLENLGDWLHQCPWPAEIHSRIAPAQTHPRSGGPRKGAIEGNVWQAEGVIVDPYVTIRANGGLIYLDRGVQLQSFVRLEAGPGETIYLGAETMVGPGSCLRNSICVGSGCRLLGAEIRGPVQIGPETTVEHAVLQGPIVIGESCELRPGAYLRENCLFGDHVVFRGEAKNVILLDGTSDHHTAAGHYVYLGDSILGRRVNLGAGTKTANLRLDNRPVWVQVGRARYPTGRRKLGAILGDDVQTGCLTVCDPGTLVGPRTWIYPGAHLHGTYPPDGIVKVRPTQETRQRRSAGRKG